MILEIGHQNYDKKIWIGAGTFFKPGPTWKAVCLASTTHKWNLNMDTWHAAESDEESLKVSVAHVVIVIIFGAQLLLFTSGQWQNVFELAIPGRSGMVDDWQYIKIECPEDAIYNLSLSRGMVG